MMKSWDLLEWLRPVLGLGFGEVMMGARVGVGRVLSGSSLGRGPPGSPVAASWEGSIPFPRGSVGQREGAAGARGVLFGRWAVRIPSARRLSRRPLGQGNKAPFSNGERRPASCVQLCAPWEPPLACWPLRLPGDEGADGPPQSLTDSPCGAPSLSQAPYPPRTLPPCCVTFGSIPLPLGCHQLSVQTLGAFSSRGGG